MSGGLKEEKKEDVKKLEGREEKNCNNSKNIHKFFVSCTSNTNQLCG